MTGTDGERPRAGAEARASTEPPQVKGSASVGVVGAVALGVVGVAIFAGTLPATRLAVAELDPMFVTFGRAAVAALLAAPLLALGGTPLPRGKGLAWLAGASLFLIVGFPLSMAFAMTSVSAGHGGVVLAILPLTTALAATAVSGERPGSAFWALSAAGGATVLAFVLAQGGGTISAGDIFLLFAACAAAFGYAFSGNLSRTMPGWAVISWALVLSFPVTAPLAVLLAPAAPAGVGASAWAGFAYVALFSMFLGFFFWNAAMALGGVAKVGQLQLLQPFLTILIAAVVAGEAVSATTLVFAAAVVAIVALAQRARVRRAE
ncbi:DMT family transporter [Acuticoccus sp.]|uniref:DMT family transporter n=1 Tax=Acuticoccus sp. TaxID=1904378 RepID=UPI003B51B34C